MYYFNFHEIAASDSLDSLAIRTLLCISCPGSIGKKCDIIRNIIQNIGQSTFVCTTQSQGDDLCIGFLNTGFYKIQ